MVSEQLVWLITGASPGGLGHHLAEAALQAGHKVVATSRKPEKTPQAVSEFDKHENAAWLQLDVTDAELEQQLEKCMERFGRIDVLVNNAGYAVGGALEDVSIGDIRRQMQTNYEGPVRLMKALIPHMRERGSGTFVNITSTEGISAMPGISVYGASKFALEAVSEAMHAELAAFGIRTLIVEPGGMRTKFFESTNVVEVALSESYKGGIVDHVLSAVRNSADQFKLDPARAAQRIVEAVTGTGEGWPENSAQYMRLPLGKECIGRMRAKVENLQTNINVMENVSITADFDA